MSKQTHVYLLRSTSFHPTPGVIVWGARMMASRAVVFVIPFWDKTVEKYCCEERVANIVVAERRSPWVIGRRYVEVATSLRAYMKRMRYQRKQEWNS